MPESESFNRGARMMRNAPTTASGTSTGANLALLRIDTLERAVFMWGSRHRDTETMSIQITLADFTDPRLGVFVQAHLDDLAPTAPVESQHALHLEALQLPTIRLFVAYENSDIVGTAALACLDPAHEEMKSMRTDPARRGRGIASRMLDHLFADARERAIRRVSLETGSMDYFAPARALYVGAGFKPCPPFGGYTNDPNSAFMTLLL